VQHGAHVSRALGDPNQLGLNVGTPHDAVVNSQNIRLSRLQGQKPEFSAVKFPHGEWI
jgi:hypothetical protein